MHINQLSVVRNHGGIPFENNQFPKVKTHVPGSNGRICLHWSLVTDCGQLSDMDDNLYNEIIDNWLNSTVKGTEWKINNDLHIDEINSDLGETPSIQWITFGIKVLETASGLLKNKDFEVTLCLHLTPGLSGLNHKFKSIQDIKSELYSTPPSLYVFKKDWANWVKTRSDDNKINIRDLDNYDVFYTEQYDERDAMYIRFVYIV